MRLLMTYKVLGRLIANYAAPVWRTNASESNIGKIQRAQNEALRIITGSHNMPSIDHLHRETEMLQVEDHLNLLSAQYLVQCVDTDNGCHHITKMDHPPREMKETIFTRHNQTVLPLLANNRKDTLQALHTSFVNTAIYNMKDNRVLNNRPPPIKLRKPFFSSNDSRLHVVEPPRGRSFSWHPNPGSPRYPCLVCVKNVIKLSPSLFNYYIADMPKPTTPVKRVCYADDITFWDFGPKIPLLESMINNYLRDVDLPEGKLAFDLSDITLEDTQLPLERSPKILGVIMDPSLSFHYVTDMIDKRNNMLNALAGSSWGQVKETTADLQLKSQDLDP